MKDRVKISDEPVVVEREAITPIPAEFASLYELAINRMNKILMDTTQKQPEVHTLTPEKSLERIPLGETASVKELLKKCICETTEGNDLCSQCAGYSQSGRIGHYPWDELEMKKHGWMDHHGHHWGPVTFEDELRLLQHGILDRAGHPVVDGQEAKNRILELVPLRSSSREFFLEDISRQVKIGGTTEIRVEDTELTAAERYQEETEMSFTEGSGQVRWSTYPVSEEKLMTKVETETKRATLYHGDNPPQLIYMERGDGEDILIIGTKNRIHITQ